DQAPHLLNPSTGFIYNSNNWPWSAAGAASQKREDFPVYVDMGREESPRGYHALRVLDHRKDFSIDGLIGAAFDSYLPAFARMIPPLLKAYDQTADDNPLKAKVADQIKVLRDWDYRWGVASIPTSLAVFWGEDISRRVAAASRRAGSLSVDDYIVSKATPDELLQSLAAASDKLTSDFGTWKTPWGNINRFQRLTGDIVQPFNDAAPS